MYRLLTFVIGFLFFSYLYINPYYSLSVPTNRLDEVHKPVKNLNLSKGQDSNNCRNKLNPTSLLLTLGKMPSESQTQTVIIGIIDKGFDWKNQCFFNRDTNENRILYIWDQNGVTQSVSNSEIQYGTEYRHQDIQKAMTMKSKHIPLETGHGWFISAIAAGDVSIRDRKKIPFWTDFKPTQPIIMVNSTGKVSDLPDAIAYIKGKTQQLNARCVIVFAYSKHSGPHDSEDPYIRRLDSMLDENTVFVTAAGNEGTQNIYRSGIISRKANIGFIIDKSKYLSIGNYIPCKIEIEIWSSGHFNVSLTSPSGNSYGPVLIGKQLGSNSQEGRIQISNQLVLKKSKDGRKKLNGAIISINETNDRTSQSGEWTLTLSHYGNSTRRKQFYRAWITRQSSAEVRFIGGDSIEKTISLLAYSQKAISVGACDYASDLAITEASYSNNPGKLPGYCSPRPDILAPGYVTVAIPGFTDPMEQEGTSVSTALIARFILYNWSKTPELNASDFKRLLSGHVVIPISDQVKWIGPSYYSIYTGLSPDLEKKSTAKRSKK